MKRIALFAMALCLVLCLCACGDDPKPAPTLPTKPTTAPSTEPTTVPTTEPTTVPTTEPVTVPTTEPTSAPTTKPTTIPSTLPTTVPTPPPTTAPTEAPTTEPTEAPTTEPTEAPTTEPTEEPTTKPAPEVDPAILGKYKLYKMKDAYGTYGLETIVPSGRGEDYIQLNVDGTADISDRGNTLYELEWDTKNMIIRDGKGTSLWPKVEGDVLTVSSGAVTLYYLRENSEDWASVRTGFDDLAALINRKGTMVNWVKVLICSYNDYTVNITNKDENTIVWDFTGDDVTLKMELMEHSSLQTISFTCGDVTGTAMVELANFDNTWTLAQVLVDGENAPTEINDAVTQAAATMVQLALQKLKPAGIYLEYLCY